MVQLGDGTEESHDRAQKAVNELWRFTGEMFRLTMSIALAGSGFGA